MATVRKRTLPSGKVRWQASYIDGGGKRRAKLFDTKRSADDWLTKTRREVQLGVHVAESDSATIGAVADLWVTHCEKVKKLEPSTIAQYHQHVEQHIKPLLGATKLAKLTSPAVHAYLDALQETRSPAMVRKLLTTLGAIIGEAQRRGLVAHNVVRDVKLGMPRRSRQAKAWPTEAELKAILAATPDDHKALVFTALFSGARASELRGLRWEQVDLKAGVLRIRERADRFNRIGAPKTAAGVRDIPLTPALAALLREHKLRSRFARPADWVFPTGAGKVESLGNWVNRIFGPIQVLAGVVRHAKRPGAEGAVELVAKGKFGLHALRHAAAALLAREGMDVKSLQRMLGHANVSTTMQVYAYALNTLDEDRGVLANVEKRLLG